MNDTRNLAVHGLELNFRALLLVACFGAVSAHCQSLTIEVRRMDFVGNSLLTPTQLSTALLTLPKALGFADIEQAAQKLQQAYTDAGYGAIVVRIAEQSLDAGTVRLDVTERRVSAIQMTGQQRFSRDNILCSLPSLSMGSTPDRKTLDAELLMANESPAKTGRVATAQEASYVDKQPQEIERVIAVPAQRAVPTAMLFEQLRLRENMDLLVHELRASESGQW